MPLYCVWSPDCDDPEELFANSPEEAVLMEARKNAMPEDGLYGYNVTVLDVDRGDTYFYEVKFVPGHFEAKRQ